MSNIVAKYYENIGFEQRSQDITWAIRYVGEARGPALQDARDTAITAVKAMLYSENVTHDFQVSKRVILDAYISTVRNLSSDEDYFGAPHSTMELGEVIAQSLGNTSDHGLHYSARAQLREVWSDKLLSYDEANRGTVGNSAIESLVSSVVPLAEDEEERWDWARPQPEFDHEPARIIHDKILIETADGKSLKGYVFRHSAQFQEKLAETGTDLARFWNLLDPDAATAVVERAGEYPELEDKISQLLQQKTGYGLKDVANDPQIGRILGDEIAAAVHRVQGRVEGQRRDPFELIDRIARQAELAVTARKPARILKPVKNFLKEWGFEPDAEDAGSILSQLHDEAVRNAIAAAIRSNFQFLSESIAKIAEPLNGLPNYPNLVLGSRDRKDMFSGDATADCTAYHLECGFNGWTQPLWLANPGFVTAYALSGNGQEVAKMGLLLAEVDGQPRLVVDSIETYKSLDHFASADALDSIMRMIDQMQQWADRNGWGDIIFCTYSNSSELTMNLPVCRNDESMEVFQALGGNSGLKEILESCDEEAELQPNDIGYIQSSATHEYDVDEEYEAEQQGIDSNLALQLEREIINCSNKDDLIEAARQGDVATFISHYIEGSLPNLHKLFGKPLISRIMKKGLKHLDDAIRLAKAEDKLTRQALEGAKYGDVMETLTLIDEGLLSETALLNMSKSNKIRRTFPVVQPLESYDEAHEELVQLKKFMYRLKKSNSSNDPLVTLRFIFGQNYAHQQQGEQQEHAQPTHILLNKHLPKVDRQLLNDYLRPDPAQVTAG